MMKMTGMSMRGLGLSRRLSGLVVLGAVALVGLEMPGTGISGIGGVVSAQAVETAPKPPTTTDSDDAPKILNFILLALLAGGVVGASVFPSKRGHQD